MGVFFALLTAFFFGTVNALVSRENVPGAINTHEGVLITLIGNNVISGLVFPIVLFNTNVPAIGLTGILAFAGAGFFTSFLGQILLFKSIHLIGASRSGSLKLSAPLFTVLIAVVFLKEKLAAPHILGIAIVLSGVLVVIKETQARFSAAQTAKGPKPEESGSDIDRKAVRLGIVISILSGLSFGTGNVLRKVGVLIYPNTLIGASINFLSAFVFLLLFIWINPFPKSMPVSVNFKDIRRRKGFKTYIFIGIFTSCAIYSVFLAVSLMNVSIVNTVASAEALFTLLVAAIILRKKELISKLLIVGALIVTTGIGIITLF